MKKSVFVSLFILTLLTASQPSSGYGLNYGFTSTSDEIISYSNYEGKPLIVDAFATWCEPCRTEIVHLKEVYEEVGDEVVILSISTDPESDSSQKIINFRDEFEAEWTFGLDHELQLTSEFNILNLPTLLIFDQNGSLVKKWSGITSVSEIYSELERSFNIDTPDVNNPLVKFDQLFDNTLFRITMGVTLILVGFVIISNYVNRGKSN